MKCPNCPAVDLLMAERQGIEIDYCPSCRGVWLDRGELDKFIERGNQENPVASTEKYAERSISRNRIPESFSRSSPKDDYEERKYKDQDFRGEDRYRDQRGKKKESFWGNLFDFD